MKRIVLVLLIAVIYQSGFSKEYDLIIKTNSDSLACIIDSISEKHFYIRMISNKNWINTYIAKSDVSAYEENFLERNMIVFKDGTSYISHIKKPVTDRSQPGFAIFLEVLGKGYLSLNADFRLMDNHRLSIGLSVLDYVYYDSAGEEHTPTLICPGIMYYFVTGRGPHNFEVGAGISIPPDLSKDYTTTVTIYGVIGYRYQIEDGLLFRAGFTPFYGYEDLFLPLVGVSAGYSW